MSKVVLLLLFIVVVEVSQSCAEKLAFCNDIGSGSYDNQVIAASTFAKITMTY
jgi:hypothetical protein